MVDFCLDTLSVPLSPFSHIEDEARLAREITEEEWQRQQDLFWLTIGLTVGVLFEPADWVLSFSEYLKTGDPSILLLAAIPLVPGTAARAGRVARSFGSSTVRFFDELDYTSVTMGGIPPDFFEKLLGALGKYFDEVVTDGGSVTVGRYSYNEHFWTRVDSFDPNKPIEGRTGARLEQDLGVTLQWDPDQKLILVGGRELPTGNRVGPDVNRYDLSEVDFWFAEGGNVQLFDAVSFPSDRPGTSIDAFIDSVKDHLTTKTDVTIVIDLEDLRIQGRFTDIEAVYRAVDEIADNRQLGRGIEYMFVPPRSN